MTKDNNPELLIFEHGDFRGISSEHLLELGRVALPLCVAQPAEEGGCLSKLREIEINLVSDEMIGQVHAEFMNDPSATDVITFHHGEIFISLDTAKRTAADFGHTFEQEALLYLIHGLLHLNGHDDKVPNERAAMKELQEQILAEVWNA